MPEKLCTVHILFHTDNLQACYVLCFYSQVAKPQGNFAGLDSQCHPSPRPQLYIVWYWRNSKGCLQQVKNVPKCTDDFNINFYKSSGGNASRPISGLCCILLPFPRPRPRTNHSDWGHWLCQYVHATNYVWLLCHWLLRIRAAYCHRVTTASWHNTTLTATFYGQVVYNMNVVNVSKITSLAWWLLEKFW